MTSLHWTEKIYGSPKLSEVMLNRATAAKKLVIIEQGGSAAAEAIFRDGGATGRIVGRLRAPANDMAVLEARDMGLFVFSTSVWVQNVTGNFIAAIVTMGDPNPTFA